MRLTPLMLLLSSLLTPSIFAAPTKTTKSPITKQSDEFVVCAIDRVTAMLPKSKGKGGISTQIFTELEPNDIPDSANQLMLQAPSNSIRKILVSGNFSPDGEIVYIDIPSAPENNGSIPLAIDTGITLGDTRIARINSFLGDAPTEAEQGDYDFFKGSFASGTIFRGTVTDASSLNLDTIMWLYDSEGNILAADDDGTGSLLSTITYTITEDGEYFVAIGAYRESGPDGDELLDPFDANSGPVIQDTWETGSYTLEMGLTPPSDFDFFSFPVMKGDLVGGDIFEDGELESLLSISPGESAVLALTQNFYRNPDIFPSSGSAGFGTVVTEDGTFVVAVSGTSGNYELDIRLGRSEYEARSLDEKQIFFLDFDGAFIDARIFGGANANAGLSPFGAFLERWGFQASDENFLIDGIIAKVRAQFEGDPRMLLTNPNFDYELLNSRDHADPFGQPNVTRVIIGGSISQLGISTIGIAQGLDLGNRFTEESAVVLLDALSAPIGDPLELNSMNFYVQSNVELRKVAVIQAVGTITSHEIGHLLGGLHTDNTTGGIHCVMDQGGNMPIILGIGNDGIFGTGDDVPVLFEMDNFDFSEGISLGVENTIARMAYALSTPRPALEGNQGWMLY